MDDTDFSKLVLEAIGHVPDDIRELIVNTVVVVEDEPPKSLLREMGIGRGGTLLGLYQGVPIDQRGFSYGNTLPDKITIFKGPILRECDTPEEIEALVIEVVIHEVGHYFGLDDDEMAGYEGDYYDEWE